MTKSEWTTAWSVYTTSTRAPDPEALAATTGTADAIASKVVEPQVSVGEGNTNTSEDAYASVFLKGGEKSKRTRARFSWPA